MIFIDTGAFLARYIERDQYHRPAAEHWRRLQQGSRRCVTSNFVLDELATLLARRTTYQFAAQRIHLLYSSKELQILRPTERDETCALELFRKFADQQVSFTDCVTFALMKRINVNSVFTFDRHFTNAGFEAEPQ